MKLLQRTAAIINGNLQRTAGDRNKLAISDEAAAKTAAITNK
jgi:hypothetical protein